MMAISSVFTRRISRALSMRSAICPLVADSSTNGAMKIAEIRNAAEAGSALPNSAAW